MMWVALFSSVHSSNLNEFIVDSIQMKYFIYDFGLVITCLDNIACEENPKL